MYIESYGAGSTTLAKSGESLPGELSFLLTDAPAEQTRMTYIETLMLLEASEDIMHMMFDTIGDKPDQQGMWLVQD